MCTYRLDEICVKELQSLEIVEIYWTHFARFSQNLLILHEMQQESESMCAKLTARIGAWYEWQGWLFHVYWLLITFVYSDEGMSWNIECCFSLLFKTRLFKKKKTYSGIFFSVHNLCTQQQWAWNEAMWQNVTSYNSRGLNNGLSIWKIQTLSPDFYNLKRQSWSDVRGFFAIS